MCITSEEEVSAMHAYVGACKCWSGPIASSTFQQDVWGGLEMEMDKIQNTAKTDNKEVKETDTLRGEKRKEATLVDLWDLNLPESPTVSRTSEQHFWIHHNIPQCIRQIYKHEIDRIGYSSEDTHDTPTGSLQRIPNMIVVSCNIISEGNSVSEKRASLDDFIRTDAVIQHASQMGAKIRFPWDTKEVDSSDTSPPPSVAIRFTDSFERYLRRSLNMYVIMTPLMSERALGYGERLGPLFKKTKKT
eukprot:GHVO01016666.1.p1 GENE.GHVO01016666.1~~GHVO01016666.1.p1  ORF type:complete len:246 (+),score=49.58 GHVO01016666.1:78-815(+)